MPKNSDWSGHHVAFYVTDIEPAVEYMVGRGVQRMPAGPFSLTQGPAAGPRWVAELLHQIDDPDIPIPEGLWLREDAATPHSISAQ